MKILMFAHEGSLNRGCEAIVRSSSNLIKNNIKKSQVYLASGKPETDTIINSLDGIFDGSDSPIKKYSYSWLVSSINVKLLKNESYALGKVHSKILKYVNDMDIFMSIGGDNYCYGEQPGWYEIDRRVKAKGKKLVLWGCSIGEEDISERKLADLGLFDLILARESITYNMLKSKGLKNVRLCADPAFTMEKKNVPLPEGWKKGNTIGLNFSPLVYKKNKKTKDSVKELIEYILKSTDSTIALTPHVLQENNNDHELLMEFFQLYKDTNRVILIPDTLDATEYKGLISNMRFFIGARTHATIAAYSSYVPTLVLGYSVKSKGIAKDLFGEERLVLDVRGEVKGKLLISGFNQLVEEEAEIKEILKISIPKIKKMSLKAVEYLGELAGNASSKTS
ncbi:polysaccharide pyruvyl transferase family protein [Sutcliffiella horikoshii]|uniref:Polysaccharide pyruvyl transferase family protein n=1 Tax=Sutcliffiella horikoshii TaxID=79883 RepID=A0AA95B6T4_9BACI|nr:polysaccharide pyruvyl transferase family protein [Sutcliffiella horikoshii]TYS60077.1 polysaccharide pyruvyl transferase family protein [Sutcliffiella horikoshii]